MTEKRDVTALPLGEGTETGSERSGLANPCPGRPEQADDSRIAVSPSPDRSATALPLRAITVETSETYTYDPAKVKWLHEQLRPDPDQYGDEPAYALFAYLYGSALLGDVFEARGDYGMWPTKDEAYDPEA